MEIKLIEEMFHQEKTLWWHVAKRKAAKTFLKQYGGPIAGKKILDIGCGTGAMMEDLTVLEADVYGLDGSSEAVGFCQRRNLKNIRLGNLERSLPFFNNFFSAITCLDVLEHITSDEKLLAEIYRILKPGGFLVISVPAYQIFWTYWDEMLGHKRRYLLRSLVKKLDPKRPIVITDSGEWGLWADAIASADILGSSVYRKAYNSNLHVYMPYPFPAAYYQMKANLVTKLPAGKNKKVIITELQSEPWLAMTSPEDSTPQKQSQAFSVKEFRDNIEFVKKIGFEENYLWGVEWWYFMAKNGYPQYLDFAKTIF